MNIVRPVQLQCNTCGQTGIAPKIRRNDTKTEIVEEAIWACTRCGTYFKRGTVSRTPKRTDEQ